MKKNHVIGLSIIGLFTLPVLFQNCAKPGQTFSSTDTSSITQQSINSNSLPEQVVVPVDQISDQTSSDDNSSNFQVVDGGKSSGDSGESEESMTGVEDSELKKAKEVCNEYKSKHKGVSGESTNEYVSGLAGSHVLTPEDFGGHGHVNCIDKVQGKLIICSLQVDEIKNTSGRVIIVDSNVKKFSQGNGRLDVIRGVVESISGFNGKVYRSSN